jgi:hypothetical protein
MTLPLFTWLVYKDRFPLAVPELLGELEAPTLAAAKNQAAARWPGVAVLIQSAASHRVRPITAPVVPAKRTNAGRPRPGARTPRSRNQNKAQYDAFCAEKRAAHDARRADRQP